MSTRKLSDNEFDKYTKNILKRPDAIPFDQSAWAAMESKLAAQPPVSWKATALRWTSYVIKSIVILNLILMISHNGVISAPSANHSAFEAERSALSIGDTNAVDPSTSDLAGFRGAASSDNTSASSNNIEQSVPAKMLTTTSNTSRTSDATGERHSKIDKRSGAPDKSITIAAEEDLQKQKLGPFAFEDNADDDRSKEYKFLNGKEPNLEVASLFEPNLILMSTIDSTQTSDQKGRKPRRFSVGAVLSPDYTTVGGFSEFDTPGLDFGIAFEYYLAKNLSVSSGAVVTKKLYRTTDLSEYQVPQGFWNGTIPEEINADCKVIDIPINLRYYAVTGRRNTLFLSTGLSSYLMLSEVYSYDYPAQYNSANLTNELTITNENNHFLGVFNMSAGVQRQISNKLSLEVEPYLKRSLKGVGWGQVQLNSTGVLFNIKYHFNTN